MKTIYMHLETPLGNVEEEMEVDENMTCAQIDNEVREWALDRVYASWTWAEGES